MAHYYVRQGQAVSVYKKQSGVLSVADVSDMKVRVDIHSEGLPVPMSSNTRTGGQGGGSSKTMMAACEFSQSVSGSRWL